MSNELVSDEVWSQVLEEFEDCVPCEPCEPSACEYAELCAFMRAYVTPSEAE
jgi:hypothetical protein